MKKQQQGFTLIELVLVIILTGIIAAITSNLLAEGFQAYLTSKNITDADWQVRLAIQRMSRDIQAIRSSSDITTASSSQLVFVDTSGTSITYQLSGTSLMRNSKILADGVQSMTFSYFTSSGASTSTISATRYIRMTLNITQSGTDFSVTTAIYPWNLS